MAGGGAGLAFSGTPSTARLVSLIRSGKTPVYYIAGPPPMVAALRTMLNNAGTDDDIRTEDLTGY